MFTEARLKNPHLFDGMMMHRSISNNFCQLSIFLWMTCMKQIWVLRGDWWYDSLQFSNECLSEHICLNISVWTCLVAGLKPTSLECLLVYSLEESESGVGHLVQYRMDVQPSLSAVGGDPTRISSESPVEVAHTPQFKWSLGRSASLFTQLQLFGGGGTVGPPEIWQMG